MKEDIQMNQNKSISINVPQYSKEYFEKLAKEDYKRLRKNKNNFSYWYPKIKNCGISIVNATIFRLPYKTWRLMEDLYESRYNLSDDVFYQSEKYKEWQKQINKMIKEVPKGTPFNFKSRNFL